MTYKDVKERGLIQGKKEKYTILDFRKVRREHPRLTRSEAKFVCRASAVHHGTEWSTTLESDPVRNMFL